MFIAGLKVVESEWLSKKELVRMCRSKAKRVKKKWLRNPKNYRQVADLSIYQMGDKLICHPIIAAEIRRNVVEAKTKDPLLRV